jgi:hypothetical protein
MEKFAILYKMWFQKILRIINGIFILSVGKILNTKQIYTYFIEISHMFCWISLYLLSKNQNNKILKNSMLENSVLI